MPDHQSPSGPSPVSVVVGAGLPKASGADAARTLVDAVALGTLSTLALDPPGHPFGSIVSFATDAGGSPLFVISELAEHHPQPAPGFDEKAPFIADAEALRATIGAYAPAGEAVGGIALVPTAIVITGDTAAVTYDVTFAGQTAYEDQAGTVERVDGSWVVGRDEFCGFMATARNPCA